MLQRDLLQSITMRPSVVFFACMLFALHCKVCSDESGDLLRQSIESSQNLRVNLFNADYVRFLFREV